MSDDAERIVPVVIHGQRYPVRSALQATYVAELAAYVDEKIRVAADENQTNDSLRVAVLAALNLADEVFRYRQDRAANAGAIASRAGEIERLRRRRAGRGAPPSLTGAASAPHQHCGTPFCSAPPDPIQYPWPCVDRDGQERRLSQCITQANRNVAPCARLR